MAILRPVNQMNQSRIKFHQMAPKLQMKDSAATKRTNVPNVCCISTPKPKISIRFTLQAVVLELQAILTPVRR